MADTAPERPERLGPGFGCIQIGFATEDRGRVTFMWHVTREVAEQWLAEFRDRMGEAHQEAIADAALIDAVTAFAFSKPRLVWNDRSAAGSDG